MSEAKKQPVYKVKVGLIDASVWENEGKEGSFLTISVHRNYKDKEDNWKTTNSLRVSDVADVKLALDKTYEFAKIKPKKEGD